MMITQQRGRPWARVAPGLAVLRRYQPSWLRGDVIAGVTVAAYMIPQVMAYAEMAGVPAVVGLWALVGPLLVYAIFGSSRQLSVGPESTVALMTALAIGTMSGDPMTLAALLALTSGAFCVIGYIARLGFLAGLLSRPVLVGYLTGVAGLMVVSQLGKVTALSLDGQTVWQKLGSFAGQLDEVNWPTLVLAIFVVAALYVVKHLIPNWPGPLLVMLVAAAIVHLGDLRDYGVQVVGAVPAGLPPIGLPDLSQIDWPRLVPAALGIAVVGYTSNALTGRAFATRHREQIDPNQELLALGLANISAGLTHSMPVASSSSRTVIADAMGSRSQTYSLVALVSLIAAMFTLGPVLAAFPSAALGGVVIYAASQLVDVAELRRLHGYRLTELVLALATALTVLLFDVLTGIGIAIVLSILDLLRRIGNPEAAVLGYVPGLAGMHNINDYSDAEPVPGLVVFRYDSPIFFANAENFRRRALAAVDQTPGKVDWFLLNFEANTQLDLTAIDALEELRQDLRSRGIVVAMARVKQDTQLELERTGFVSRLDGRIYPTLPTAVGAYVDWIAERDGARPAWAVSLPLPQNWRVNLTWPVIQPTLPGDGCTLRPWRSKDAAAVYAACQDPQIQRFTTVPVPYQQSHARGFVEMGPRLWADRSDANFAIVDVNDWVLGACSLMKFDEEFRSAEIGYWVAPWARGKGYASCALKLISAWGRDGLGLTELSLWIVEGNEASEAVARSAGYAPAGQFKEMERLGATVRLELWR